MLINFKFYAFLQHVYVINANIVSGFDILIIVSICYLYAVVFIMFVIFMQLSQYVQFLFICLYVCFLYAIVCMYTEGLKKKAKIKIY